MASTRAASISPDRRAADGARPGSWTERSGAPTDGRVLRGEQTRLQIIDATIELIHAGNPEPTSSQIASQAGVSVRLLFYHFRRMDDLFLSATTRQFLRHRSLIAILPPKGPVEARIRATCRQRRQLFEATAPVLRMAYSRADRSPVTYEVLAEKRLLLRRQVAVTLGPEISLRGSRAPALLETVALASGWHSWDALRSHSGYSANASEGLMASALVHLLG